MMEHLEWFEQRYPDIPWRTPLKISMPGAVGYACRVCIAREGITGTDVDRVFATPEALDIHIAHAHQERTSQEATP